MRYNISVKKLKEKKKTLHLPFFFSLNGVQNSVFFINIIS